MSKTVTPADIDIAINLIHISIFGIDVEIDDKEKKDEEPEDNQMI
jgi:DNA replicative helicase MCM subunit Mcm2 (Cdc46/Mcm family)